MSEKLKHFFENLVPFVILGIVIALMVGFFIMFSYVLFWGLVIGGILWAITFLKNLLISKQPKHPPEETKGRIIEHNDKD